MAAGGPARPAREWTARGSLGRDGAKLDATFDPTDLAEFLLCSWEGAILRMKVEGGPAALERFRKIVFQTVFKELK